MSTPVVNVTESTTGVLIVDEDGAAVVRVTEEAVRVVVTDGATQAYVDAAIAEIPVPEDVSTSAAGFAPIITGSDGDVLTKSGAAAVWATPEAVPAQSTFVLGSGAADNEFATWAELYAALSLTKGRRFVRFDITCEIPVGTYDLAGVTLLGGATAQTVLYVYAGVTLQNVDGIAGNLWVIGNGAIAFTSLSPVNFHVGPGVALFGTGATGLFQFVAPCRVVLDSCEITGGKLFHSTGAVTLELRGSTTIGEDIVSASGDTVVVYITTYQAACSATQNSAAATRYRYVLDSDARLTDARTPTAHASSHQSGGADEIATIMATPNGIPKADSDSWLNNSWLQTGTTPGTIALGDDARFTDARTPTAHASSHRPGGSDSIPELGAAAWAASRSFGGF